MEKVDEGWELLFMSVYCRGQPRDALRCHFHSYTMKYVSQGVPPHVGGSFTRLVGGWFSLEVISGVLLTFDSRTATQKRPVVEMLFKT